MEVLENVWRVELISIWKQETIDALPFETSISPFHISIKTAWWSYSILFSIKNYIQNFKLIFKIKSFRLLHLSPFQLSTTMHRPVLLDSINTRVLQKAPCTWRVYRDVFKQWEKDMKNVSVHETNYSNEKKISSNDSNRLAVFVMMRKLKIMNND